jgi:hypothetical protein
MMKLTDKPKLKVKPGLVHTVLYMELPVNRKKNRKKVSPQQTEWRGSESSETQSITEETYCVPLPCTSQ